MKQPRSIGAVEEWYLKQSGLVYKSTVSFSRDELGPIIQWVKLSGFDTIDGAIRACIFSVIETDRARQIAEREMTQERVNAITQELYAQTRDFLLTLDGKVAALLNEKIE